MTYGNLSDHYLLTCQQMKQADIITSHKGGISTYQLMLNAGLMVADSLLRDFPNAKNIAVLVGSGNNGGDGLSAAAVLKKRGINVRCFANKTPSLESDAGKMLQQFSEDIEPFTQFDPSHYDLIIDALYGTGLNRPLKEQDALLIDRVNASIKPIVSIDLPSGICGDSGQILGTAIKARLTVTFFRLKPGHCLYPGKDYAGKILCENIGISSRVFDDIKPKLIENHPNMWKNLWPTLNFKSNKYSRGHCLIFGGAPSCTGAARLSAHASARIGAGLVSLLCQSAALLINASQLTSVMVHVYDNLNDITDFIKDRKVTAAVIGPGFGERLRAREITLEIMLMQAVKALVIDADAISAFSENAVELFNAIERSSVKTIITPHQGEFKRLFPEIAEDENLSKVEKAQKAAKRAHSIIILKGADTVIAGPDGRAAINTNAPFFLATAGSGDVLAGLCGGLLAQSMPVFEAACAATYLHSETANIVGMGLIAEDLIDSLPQALRWLFNPNLAIKI